MINDFTHARCCPDPPRPRRIAPPSGARHRLQEEHQLSKMFVTLSSPRFPPRVSASLSPPKCAVVSTLTFSTFPPWCALFFAGTCNRHQEKHELKITASQQADYLRGSCVCFNRDVSTPCCSLRGRVVCGNYRVAWCGVDLSFLFFVLLPSSFC